jgi:hypothetical protein
MNYGWLNHNSCQYRDDVREYATGSAGITLFRMDEVGLEGRLIYLTETDIAGLCEHAATWR